MHAGMSIKSPGGLFAAEVPGSGWRKSTRSFANGNCVEVTSGYRKPSKSIGNGNCAEVASGAGAVLVRDTANRTGGMLSFTARAWAEFTARTAGARQ